ncbi:site-specific integrase [Labrenzia sp. PHM005]|uniref:tyrosine-type recombinase/integrase n=1 Tax=Labrenzia sp. PHM005 TaxID=2590016 RepID=UPI00113FEA29|nr:site-specific integrase [Labrenzia sp. PHM005]QDG76719.1 site-specific integrase [Labrenzia sp. PHM005]
MPRLSKRAIDAAKPRAKQWFLWDDSLKGFGLVILPSGKKSFILQYRTMTTRSRRLTIGPYGALTPAEARRMASELIVQVRNGHDPLMTRQGLRSAPTINDLLDKYWSDHVMVHNAKATQLHHKRIITKILRPHFGAMKVTELTRPDVAELHAKLKHTPRQANLVLSVLSKALNLAEVWGLRPELSNPVRLIQRYKEVERDRFLSDEELSRLGATLDEAERFGLPWVIKAGQRTRKHLPKEHNDRRTPVSKPAIFAVRLLLHTGARVSEILTTEWSHIDFPNRTIALPSRKGDGRKPHPASDTVMKLLTQLYEKRRSNYILPRDADATRHITREVVQNAWQRIREHAQIEDIRLHDLRHTVGTYAAQAGGNAFLISHLLRHRNVTITNRYVNTDLDPIRVLSELIGQRLLEGLAKRQALESRELEADGNVIQFPGRRPFPS